MTTINRDQLTNARMHIVCKQAFEFANSMDDLNPGEQVASILVFAKLLCEHKGVDLRDALGITQNIIADAIAKENIHVKALKHYIETALK